MDIKLKQALNEIKYWQKNLENLLEYKLIEDDNKISLFYYHEGSKEETEKQFDKILKKYRDIGIKILPWIQERTFASQEGYHQGKLYVKSAEEFDGFTTIDIKNKLKEKYKDEFTKRKSYTYTSVSIELCKEKDKSFFEFLANSNSRKDHARIDLILSQNTGAGKNICNYLEYKDLRNIESINKTFYSR